MSPDNRQFVCHTNTITAQGLYHSMTFPDILIKHATQHNNNKGMHLTPKEQDKLTLLSLGLIAERRKARGLKLNHPEAVAYITSVALESAREGKGVEEVMKIAAEALTKQDVMEGVADMIGLLQVEAVFTDGSRLVSIHNPIR